MRTYDKNTQKNPILLIHKMFALWNRWNGKQSLNIYIKNEGNSIQKYIYKYAYMWGFITLSTAIMVS